MKHDWKVIFPFEKEKIEQHETLKSSPAITLQKKKLSIFISIDILSVCYFVHLIKPEKSVMRIGDGVHGPQYMVWIPGNTFVMGNNSQLAQENEKPAQQVTHIGFRFDD